MDLRHLRYFQAVAEELSYAAAARRLHIAQPALSRAVQELEAFLGAPVLERSRHHVRLTPAGTVLLHETALLLEHWEELARRVRRTAAGEEGELRLGYIGPPTRPFLNRLLHEYRRLYPGVSVHLEERTPERVWEMVAKERLHLGITRPVPSGAPPGLATLHLRNERLGAALAADHALARRRSIPWRQLAREPLIVLARREGIGLHDTILAGCRDAGFLPRFAHTPSLIGTVLTYVEAGSGIGIVPDSVLPPGDSVRFVPLVPARTVPLVLVWHERNEVPPARQFRRLIEDWKDARLLWPALQRVVKQPPSKR